MKLKKEITDFLTSRNESVPYKATIKEMHDEFKDKYKDFFGPLHFHLKKAGVFKDTDIKEESDAELSNYDSDLDDYKEEEIKVQNYAKPVMVNKPMNVPSVKQLEERLNKVEKFIDTYLSMNKILIDKSIE